MTRKQKFLLEHDKIAVIVGTIDIWKYRIKRVGKTEPIICESCRNKGCFKNRFSKRFKAGSLFSAECYVPDKVEDLFWYVYCEQRRNTNRGNT